MIDIERARAETPACANIIHFNNAGSSLIPISVQNAVSEYLDIEYNIGGYEAYDKYIDKHKGVYSQVANLINVKEEEIVLTTSASHSYGLAIQSLQLKPGDKVLCCHAEYISNYFALLLQQRKGIELAVVPDNSDGEIDIEALEKMIDGKTKLISLTHVPTSGGLINPAEEVGNIARQYGIKYIIDACQSVGQLDVNAAAIGCDMLAATGRKYLRAPRGTGFLFVKKDLLPLMEPAIVDGWGGEWTSLNEFRYRDGRVRMELFEKNYAAYLGLGAAAAYAREWGLHNIAQRNTGLSASLRSQLSELKGVSIHDQGKSRSAIVTFSMAGRDHTAIMAKLRSSNINVTISSGVNARLDLGLRGIESVLRASLHYYNTDEEIVTFVDAIRKM